MKGANSPLGPMFEETAGYYQTIQFMVFLTGQKNMSCSGNSRSSSCMISGSKAKKKKKKKKKEDICASVMFFLEMPSSLSISWCSWVLLTVQPSVKAVCYFLFHQTDGTSFTNVHFTGRLSWKTCSNFFFFYLDCWKNHEHLIPLQNYHHNASQRNQDWILHHFDEWSSIWSYWPLEISETCSWESLIRGDLQTTLKLYGI